MSCALGAAPTIRAATCRLEIHQHPQRGIRYLSLERCIGQCDWSVISYSLLLGNVEHATRFSFPVPKPEWH